MNIDDNQRANPSGCKGMLILNKMRKAHKRLSLYGINLLNIKDGSNILDIGCGCGVNIKNILKRVANTKATGIDISKDSYIMSSLLNKKYINNGRCNIYQMNVLDMAFKPSSFQYVTAICTISFWDNLDLALAKIFDILTAGGKFLICGHGKFDVEDVITRLHRAGFDYISRFKENDYLAIIATKKINKQENI